MRFVSGVAALAVFAAGFAFAQSPEWPDLTGQSIRVAGVWTGDGQRDFETVLGAFEDLTGARVEFFSTGDDIATIVGTQIEGGNPPDIAMLPQPGLLMEFARRGALVSIEDFAGDLVDANFANAWRELGTVDGELYGVWLKAANKSLLWYNADLLAEFGVEPPTTWDEFTAAAQTVYDFGLTPVSVGAGSAWTLTDWFENVYIHTAGPDLYDQLTNREIPWTHESVTEALGKLAEVWRPEWLAGGTQATLEANHGTGVTQPFVDPPAAAFAYGADFSAGGIANETNAELGVTARFVPFPSIDGSPPAVVGGGDVAVMLRDSEAARELIRFFAMPDSAEVWAPLGGYTSPNQAVDMTVYPTEINRASAEALAQAETFRFDMSDLQPSAFGGTPGQGMFGILVEFLQDLDADKAAAALEQAAAAAHD